MVALANIASFTSSASVIASFLASTHQFYLGYIYEGADGFSAVLLFGWLLGDLLNVVGTIWTHQLMFQRIIALASLSSDILLAGQHVYYKRKHKFYISPKPVQANGFGWRSKWNALLRPYILFSLVSASRAQYLIGGENEELIDWEFLIGQCMAWLAELSYAFALIPQVMDNFSRKCTGSVSIVMFLADTFSSFNYLATILITANEKSSHRETIDFVMDELPYICGTAACALLDIVLLAQYFVYPEFIEAPASPRIIEGLDCDIDIVPVSSVTSLKSNRDAESHYGSRIYNHGSCSMTES